jgi:non-homologous end joining protein Ku
VPVTEEELESLEAEANRNIDLKEFIPLASVDPVTLKILTISPPNAMTTGSELQCSDFAFLS